jgi:hypothetical protein
MPQDYTLLAKAQETVYHAGQVAERAIIVEMMLNHIPDCTSQQASTVLKLIEMIQERDGSWKN